MIYEYGVFYELTLSVTSSKFSGLIAQLVEHCIGFAEVVGSNPVQT